MRFLRTGQLRNGKLPANLSSEVLLYLIMSGNRLSNSGEAIDPDRMAGSFSKNIAAMSI